jgi:hypothetical protein
VEFYWVVQRNRDKKLRAYENSGQATYCLVTTQFTIGLILNILELEVCLNSLQENSVAILQKIFPARTRKVFLTIITRLNSFFSLLL